MAKTLREKYIDALVKLGEQQVKVTHKYVVYSCKHGGYYYVGKSGSLRIGQTVAGSIPASDTRKKMMLSL